MEAVLENNRFIKRAYWLIRLRWIATVSVAVSAFFSANILNIELQEIGLYGIAVLLAIYNTAMFVLLNYLVRDHRNVSYRAVKKTISFQICADLVILTMLLHFSGGVENPFVFYFIFHMIIASILLSIWQSYLQATFGVLLFGLLVFLEYIEIVPHYCLKGFVTNCLRREGFYVLGTLFVFTTSMYLVVYMTSYISLRLRRAERAHRQANEQLREKDRIKDEYVLRVTHDIKGHLAAIQSCLDVVNDELAGPLNPKQADFVSRARGRTVKLTSFVRTLLKLTNMRLNHNLEMDVFSLKKTIESAVTTARARAEQKSIALDFKVEMTEEKIMGHQLSIEELITNLIFNAIKYTTENGKVNVTAKDSGDCVLIEIRDTGIGIPQEELSRVFDEFFRAANARKVEKDGSGLGLSIAKQIVERHNGRIWIASEEGKGTCVKISLPKAA